MLNNFEEYYMTLVDYSKEELTDVATKSFYYINNLLKEEFTDKDFIMNVMIDLLDGFIICDGNPNKDELDLYNAIFESEFTIEDLNDLISSHSDKAKERLSKLEKIKMKNKDFRETLFLLGSSVAAIDGQINVKEQEYIEKYVRVDIVKDNNISKFNA